MNRRKASSRIMIIFFSVLAVIAALAAWSLSNGGAEGRAIASTAGHVGVSAGGCEVGQPPRLRPPRVSGVARDNHGTAIGCAERRFHGPVEIAAYSNRGQLCIAVEHIRQREFEGGPCKPEKLSWSKLWCKDSDACVLGVSQANEYTDFSGLLPSRAYAVTVASHGHRINAEIAVASVTGQLRQDLNTREPFGYFAVIVPGCMASGEVEVSFFDRDNKLMGEAEDWSGPPTSCS